MTTIHNQWYLKLHEGTTRSDNYVQCTLYQLAMKLNAILLQRFLQM